MAMQIQAGTNAELVKVLQALVIFFIAGKWSVMKLIEHHGARKPKHAAVGKGGQAS